MIMNMKMKKMVEKMKLIKRNNHIIRPDLDSMSKLFCPQFVNVHDCISISDKPIILSEEKFLKVIEMHNDKIGYEACNTDTRINDYIVDEISDLEALSIAFMTIGAWSNKLKILEPNSQFCFIMDCNDGYVTLRFHKVRADENGWLCNDIDSYTEPIGYLIK